MHQNAGFMNLESLNAFFCVFLELFLKQQVLKLAVIGLTCLM